MSLKLSSLHFSVSLIFYGFLSFEDEVLSAVALPTVNRATTRISIS
jgi:hypothetical protein